MRYNAFDKINLFFKTYIEMFANTLRPSSWAPFFYLAVLQAIGLVLLTWFSMPGWKAVIEPILAYILPQEPFHFPRYLLTVPRVFSDYNNYILGPTAWVIFSAVAVFKLGGLYEEEKWPASEGFSRAFRAYFKLLFVWLIEMALAYIIFAALSILFVEVVWGSPRRLFALKAVIQYIAFIPSAFLIYSLPAIILDRKPLFAALGESLRICGHNFFTTYFIIAIPGTVRLIFDIVIRDFGPRIIYTLNPDIVIWLMGMKIFFGIGIHLFTIGAATYLYRDFTKDKLRTVIR